MATAPTALAAEVIEHSTGYWQIAAFGLGPDLALFYGAGPGLARGQIHPRAVRLSNSYGLRTHDGYQRP